MNKRVILIVMDSVGIGEMPDARQYGDEGSNTLKHIYEAVEGLKLHNLEELGLGHIDGVDFADKRTNPVGAYGKMNEASPGKDTTTGHWEMSGIILDSAFATFPQGFGEDIIGAFTMRTGYEILCNKPISGITAIKEYGEEHMRTKKLIVYTSADSVFQIAAHEEVVPLEELYEICKKAREILDPYYVGRVIARPFLGKDQESFYRTTNRRDFSMVPFEDTLLDKLKAAGHEVCAVGKIEDIFAGRGVTQAVHTSSNDDGIRRTLEYMNAVRGGLIFSNLVDFDMLYGHRNDFIGYADALKAFDERIPEIISAMSSGDILMITADHGCDPTTQSTDHSREYVPLLVYAKDITPVNLGIRRTFADIGATVAQYLGVGPMKHGESFLNDIFPRTSLKESAAT